MSPEAEARARSRRPPTPDDVLEEVAFLRTPFELSPRPGDLLRGDLWTPRDRPASDAALVVCHGFKGFKDWGFFPYLCGELAGRTGARVVSFNFSGNGVGADLETFSELDKFSRNTPTKEVQDLAAILTGIGEGRLGQVDTEPADRIGLFGHSRGGAVAVLGADALGGVQALVTWAAIASLQRYADVFAADIEAEGIAWVVNTRTGQRLPLRRDMLDDLRANPERLDVMAAAGRIRSPWLILHGAADQSVPLDDARTLARSAGPTARLEVIEGAGHTLDAVHPFSGPNRLLRRAIDLTVGHFRAHLGEPR